MKERLILHYDMDYFYAQVEIRDNPELRGKSVIIGSNPFERGIVCTCSYEARKYGIRSGMSAYKALLKCPDAIFIKPDMKKISEISRQVQEISKEYSDVIEYISLDEAYIELTNTKQLFFNGNPIDIALDLKDKVFEKTRLTCSVGLGYNKLSAKIASEYRKPNGIYRFRDRKQFVNHIIDKELNILHGIGKHTFEKLRKYNIKTVRELQNLSLEELKKIFGIRGEHIYYLSRGIDEREVIGYSIEKSIGNSKTLEKDVSGLKEVKKAIIPVIKKSSYRMKKKNRFSRCITVMLKYSNFKSITRAKKIKFPVNTPLEIYNVVCEILEKEKENLNSIRMVGVAMSDLVNSKQVQLSLDSNLGKWNKLEKLDDLVFDLREKFGYDLFVDPIDYK